MYVNVLIENTATFLNSRDSIFKNRFYCRPLQNQSLYIRANALCSL